MRIPSTDRRWWRTLAAVAAMAATATCLTGKSVSAAPPHYTAVPLVAPGGAHGPAAGINNHGHVVLTAAIASDGRTRAFVHDGTRLTDLGTLGGPSSHAAAINDSGAVTGSADAPSGKAHAFLYAGGKMTDLGAHGAMYCSAGTAIDETGRVVGYADFACEANIQAMLYADGAIVPLRPGIGILSMAYGINERGDVTGFTYFAGRPGPTAVVWAGGSMTELDTFPGHSSEGHAINDAGMVVGGAMPLRGPYRAFAHIDGRATDLGSLGADGSFALGVNDRGHIVGWATRPDRPRGRAFVYIEGRMYDLNDLVTSGLDGATLTQAVGINERGQVVANDCLVSCRAFRLDPILDQAVVDVTDVPTLSHWALGATTLLLVAATTLRLRRR